jgi:pteridine reductase
MDKTALITGAAHRIGAEIARSVHLLGYRVAIHYRSNRDAALRLAASLNDERAGSAITLQGDLSLARTAQTLIETIEVQWGRLDLLVNNASIFEPSDPSIACVEAFDSTIATNIRAPYLLSTNAAVLLRDSGGCIVNLTDISASRPPSGYAVYCASKAGLIGLTKAMARDLAPEIRVNGVSPGAIIWAEDEDAEHRAEVVEKTPLGRQGATTDIAQAVCYLAEAPYVTGHILEVDGGRSIYI